MIWSNVNRCLRHLVEAKCLSLEAIELIGVSSGVCVFGDTRLNKMYRVGIAANNEIEFVGVYDYVKT